MTVGQYQTILIKDHNEPLVDLSQFDFVLEPVYFSQGLSTEKRMFLREGVARKLVEAQKGLGGYKFKIWDAWRSRNVQNAIYQKFFAELRARQPDWNEQKIKTRSRIYPIPTRMVAL